MPCTSGDWQRGVDYDYFDDLTPEQTAFEFLRRDETYGDDYAALRTSDTSAPMSTPAAFSTRWGLRFAINPSLHGDRVSPVWLARVNPGLALLTRAPSGLVDGPDPSALKSASRAAAEEGLYLHLTHMSPQRQALILSGADGPLVLVMPMDTLFVERLETARRMARALARGAAAKPAGFTAQRRRRLKLISRALDGSLSGADYRQIAHGLFGARVPVDAQWRTSSIRSQTIRLVKDGLALMRGGYLRLLRPDGRQR